jgi:hypothetical protein
MPNGPGYHNQRPVLTSAHIRALALSLGGRQDHTEIESMVRLSP